VRATFDWDDDEVMAQNLQAAKQLSENRGGWTLKQSSSGDGYHFVAYGAVNDTRQAYERLIGLDPDSQGLRAAFGDDEKRIALDRKRWNLGSPFQQVLYDWKYLSRSDRKPFSTGNEAHVINGYNVVDEDERILNESGRLDYDRALNLLLDREGYTQRDLAETTQLKSYRDEQGGRSRSTVGRYYRNGGLNALLDKVGSGHPLLRVVRRRARSAGIGHFEDDESRTDRTQYRDGRTRRTLVEYIDVPWGSRPREGSDADRDYRLAQVETGTVNENHTDGQHRYVHEQAVGRVLDRLSPTSPENGVTLDLDRDLLNPMDSPDDLRQPDAVHYEDTVLDDGEAEVYWGNLPNRQRIDGDPKDHVTVEVMLWNEEMTSVEWHVLAVDDGDGWTQHTVLKDSTGWW
jgi:hypothetical protein